MHAYVNLTCQYDINILYYEVISEFSVHICVYLIYTILHTCISSPITWCFIYVDTLYDTFDTTSACVPSWWTIFEKVLVSIIVDCCNIAKINSCNRWILMPNTLATIID